MLIINRLSWAKNIENSNENSLRNRIPVKFIVNFSPNDFRQSRLENSVLKVAEWTAVVEGGFDRNADFPASPCWHKIADTGDKGAERRMRAQQSEYIKYLGVRGTWKTAVPEGLQMCLLRIRFRQWT